MSRGITDDYVEQVRENCNFEELIQARCQGIKRAAGDRLVTLCPFHQEKTGSFNVNLTMKQYYCFGCKAHGDVFSFVMELEHLDFPEAVRFLARRCGMPEPEEKTLSPEDRALARARRDRKTRLEEMHAVFARWYMEILRNRPDSAVHRYFLTRGIPWETADRFMLGAAPQEWEGALAYGRGIGFSEEEMLEGGILIRNEERNRLYDRFRNRLMFPIWNEAGRVVGFSARIVETDPKAPKYVNSPESPIFKKGELLYALPLARDGIRRLKMAILCEGQLDAIAYHRAGFDCAAAPQGTGFTAEQAKLLSRYTSRILLSFDADSAGRKATLAALEHLLPLNFEVRSIAIDGGKDPDEILRNEGEAGVAALVDKSVDLSEILFRHLAGEVDLASPFGKDQAVKTLEHYFGMLSSPVVRSQYWELAATRLNLPPEVLYAELRRIKLQDAANLRIRGSSQRPEPPAPVPVSVRSDAAAKLPRAVAHAAETLLEIALCDEGAARQVADEAPHTLLDRMPAGRALNWLAALALNGEWAELPQRVAAMIEEVADDGVVAKAVAAGCRIDAPHHARAVADCVAALRRHHAAERRAELKNALAAAAGTADEARLFEELRQLGS